MTKLSSNFVHQDLEPIIKGTSQVLLKISKVLI